MAINLRQQKLESMKTENCDKAKSVYIESN
jgi:hypothetical protein